MNCPICCSSSNVIFKYLECESFDYSYLYRDACVVKCSACGHLYNRLTDASIRNLRKYYEQEHVKNTITSSSKRTLSIGINGAYSIPFEDNSFDVVILNHVLEHLTNLKLAMKEVKRVLSKNGLCYIDVPDAERYFGIYWYIMREHVQHFSLNCLKLLAQENGFELIDSGKAKVNMVGTLKLPNLSVTLKHSGKVYCFGIGREFMYSYFNTRLKHLDLVLVDDTPEKQKKTFKEMKIYSSDILKEASEDSFLIITAKVHEMALRYKVAKLGYKGRIIDV